MLAARGRCNDGRELMLVREIVHPRDEDYTRSGVDHAQLRPDFVARVAKQARLENYSLTFAHSHPGIIAPRFSEIDDRGEEQLRAFLDRRGQTVPHAALVVGESGVSARVLGENEPLRVISVGSRRIVEFDPNVENNTGIDLYDRQVRAFGVDGQRVLRSLRVAVVGLGGTGSIVVQQLVHLGVCKFILIDNDKLELTNLNRVVNAFASDLGRSKCEIAADYVKRFLAEPEINLVNGDVIYESVARHLVDADVIFCCTDSHGSRSVIQQIAYQYLIPCVDIGSSITTAKGKVTGIFGRVQLLGPDQPCLWCSELLNSNEVRRDMMNEIERRADPYVQGANVPAPSVISINGTVVSIAITMILGVVTSVPVQSRYIIYDASRSGLRTVRSVAKEDCFVCSSSPWQNRLLSQAARAKETMISNWRS